MEQFFDNLARQMAAAMSRRDALRIGLGALLGAATGCGSPAAPCGGTMCGGTCLPAGTVCCSDSTGSYCQAGSACCNGKCIPVGTVCCSNGNYCPGGTACINDTQCSSAGGGGGGGVGIFCTDFDGTYMGTDHYTDGALADTTMPITLIFQQCKLIEPAGALAGTGIDANGQMTIVFLDRNNVQYSAIGRVPTPVGLGLGFTVHGQTSNPNDSSSETLMLHKIVAMERAEGFEPRTPARVGGPR